MKRRIRSGSIPALAALALAACLSAPDRNAGGGSDTETLTGLISQPGGNPAAHVQVKLVPWDYDPNHPDTSRIRKAMTDADGKFRFEKVDTNGIWNVIAGDAGMNSWAFARNLKPGSAVPVLALTAAKLFRFSMHAGPYAPADSGVAYFPGTDILARCNGTTATTVDSVPLGALRFVVESRSGWKHDTTLASVVDGVDVQADKEKVVLRAITP